MEKIDKIFSKRIGEELEKVRKRRNISLRELQEITGISRTSLSRYERGIIRMNNEEFKVICNALKIEPNFSIEFVWG